ncbi:MAG TPA: diguanylate cyclase [Myxococcota bacterium]|nr:diguanylate cyclase [Myxococcota bacterium]
MTAAAQNSHRTLPSPPAGLAMIIQATGDPSVSSRALSNLISREPAFTAEMLRLANSPFYSPGRQVNSVQQATLFMGTRTIRNIALAHAVRATTANVDTGEFDRVLFWENSLRRAIACQVLATVAGYEDPCEAMTVGLLQDIGVLLLAIAHPHHGGALQRATSWPGARRLEEERKLCGMTHPEIVMEQADTWGLPDTITLAIAHHHGAAPVGVDRQTRRLAEVAHCADAVADIVQTEAAGNTVAHARRLLEHLPSRAHLDLEAVCEQVRDDMTGASLDMRIDIKRQPTLEELVSKANQSLLSVNASYEEFTKKLEELLDEKEHLTEKLRQSNVELRRLATTDPLTGLFNRRAFTEAMGGAIDSCCGANRQPLSVLMLDIDHFKSVNDTWGHSAGDAVIKAVSALIEKCVRGEDSVGRLGGEEFSVLLPGTPEQGARFVGERIRRTIEQMTVDCGDDVDISVTISVGGVTIGPKSTVPSGDDLLSAADAALYESKEGGRNRVSWSG